MRVQSSTCSGSRRRCHRCCHHPGSSTGIPCPPPGQRCSTAQEKRNGPATQLCGTPARVEERRWSQPTGRRALFRSRRDAGGLEAGRYGSVGAYLHGTRVVVELLCSYKAALTGSQDLLTAALTKDGRQWRAVGAGQRPLMADLGTREERMTFLLPSTLLSRLKFNLESIFQKMILLSLANY